MKIISNASQVKRIVTDFTDFISQTYGPAGQKILIQEPYGIRAVDDGKAAAQAYELKNESDQAVISYIKEATEKTDTRVGDGTTTAAIITGAIINEVLSDNELLAKNPHAEVLKLRKAVEEAVKQIQKQAKPVKTKEELYAIAYNSYNNEEIAHLISETLFKIGKDGVLSIEDSPTAQTEVETSTGLELEKGFVSPYFITEGEKVSLKNAAVILVNKRVESFKELTPLVKPMFEAGQKEFVVVAEGFGEEVITTLIINKLQGHLRPLLVENPSYSDKLEILKDISATTGGVIFDDKTGVKFENATLDSLGRAVTVTAKKGNTVIVGTTKKTAIDARVKELKTQLETASKFDKEKLEKRVAALTGGVAVIKIGANTENEQKTMKLKVEDAVNATKVAFKDGIVQGAGRTFESIKTSSEVLNNALKAPRKVLEKNGKEFLDENVSDPAGVAVAALESAVSIASGLIEVGGIIAIEREKKDKEY